MSDDTLTRIQKKNRNAILEAALDVFSTYGFRGATIDQIADASNLSKTNLLYYFPSKEILHKTLLDHLLVTWLDPLHEINADGHPIDEILSYVTRKLEMSRQFPRESRLFANEMLRGAPQFRNFLSTDLKTLVDDKAALFSRWMEEGRINKVHPYHLIFSMWSLTQHYADFDVQVRAILGDEDPFAGAAEFIETVYKRLLVSRTTDESVN